MRKLNLTGLSILSGVLMGISWPETGGISPLFFIALVPLLYVEYIIANHPEKYKSRHLFFYAYLTFIIFTTITTWWIWFASAGGMIMVEVIYSLFMAITFLLFHKIKKSLGNKRGYLSLIILWVAFEWVHYNWEFAHPWNTFGNVFANTTKLIQWYEYTGVLGGTIWVLVANILFFHLFKNIFLLKESIKKNSTLIISIALFLILPAAFSMATYYNYVEEKNPIEIVVVQPNIDPYNDKFSGMTEAEQINNIIALAKQKITPKTQYVVAPETAIPNGFSETYMEQNYGIQEIKKLINQYPNTKFVIGASTYKAYPVSKKKPTPTARFDGQTGGWYDAFNTALQIGNTNNIQIYHKSKLVLGVEKIPFPKFFNLFEKYAIDLGGTTGSLGTEKSAKNFTNGSIKIAPIICYESIFGAYVATYVKKGANALFVITNDGWWKNTPGYKQHLAYARLRAIETRRSIARSANTGTSCFINQRGDVTKATKWWTKAVIKSNINLNTVKTFYVTNGNQLGRIAAFLSLLLIIWSWSVKMKNNAH